MDKTALPDPHAQPDLEPRPAPLSRARATRWARRSTTPTRSSCARTTCTRWTIPASVKAIGRAGAGTNNIPVAEMSKRGVPVFNAPGANANAVKELVLAALLLAARNVIPALSYVAGLDGAAPDLETRVEDGKKQFAGIELPQRTLGIIGLGRDREPRRRHRDQARDEGRRASTPTSPSMRPGGCRRPCAARTRSRSS